jgi:hypothetical protein
MDRDYRRFEVGALVGGQSERVGQQANRITARAGAAITLQIDDRAQGDAGARGQPFCVQVGPTAIPPEELPECLRARHEALPPVAARATIPSAVRSTGGRRAWNSRVTRDPRAADSLERCRSGAITGRGSGDDAPTARGHPGQHFHQQRLLDMQAVLGLVEDDRLRPSTTSAVTS